MASSGFQFKQFFVAHDQCAMKVNTDGILLGAVADIQQAKQVLDIGTGTGLVALMLAQRTGTDVEITGLEIDLHAFEQATQNVTNSPWASRISLLQGDIFSQTLETRFDLIVSNPPYFAHSLPTRDPQRDLARSLTQSHLQWLAQAKHWLAPNGKITFILPADAGETLCTEAQNLGLYCTEKWQICTKSGKTPKRQILTWQREQKICKEKNLEIYQQDNQYSLAFRNLTSDFYLNI